MARYVCQNEERRAFLRDPAKNPHHLNGIDFLEVVDGGRKEDEPLRQRFLAVRLFRDVTASLGADNVRIEGGAQAPRVGVQWALRWQLVLAAPGIPQKEKDFLIAQLGVPDLPARLLIIRTSTTGDYSIYRLRVVKSPSVLEPRDDFDPRMSGWTSPSRRSAPAISTASRCRTARPSSRTSRRSAISPRTTRASGA
jgi:hypothetical protein